MLSQSVSVGEFSSLAGNGKLGPEMPRAIPPQLGKILSTLMLADVKDRFDKSNAPDGSPWKPLRHPRVNGGNKPLLDTGILRASLFAGHGANTVYVATTHPGAALQNFGGVVRPRRAKMLAIPLTKEAKRAGSPRRFRGTLQFQPTRRDRRFLLVEVPSGSKRKAGGPGVPQFLLVDSVTVPARPFMGLSASALQKIDLALAEAIERGWLNGGVK